jgi:NitT/TauT family transport system permease protein
LPPPESVIPLFFALFPRAIGPHLAASALRVCLAILVSAAAAIPCGIALGRVKILDRLASPVAYLLYPVPKIAFLPLLLLALGLGEASKIAVLFLIVYFQILVSVRDGVKAIDPVHLGMARSLGLGPAARLFKVIVPASLPALFSGLRTAAGTAVSVLFFAESVSASEGLGFFVMDAWMRVDYGQMCAGILALGLLGSALFALIDAAERAACPWKRGGARSPTRGNLSGRSAS